MQVLSSLRSAKNRHPDCKVVRRKGRIYVICKSNPRFKAVQGRKKKRKYYSAICLSQSPVAAQRGFFYGESCNTKNALPDRQGESVISCCRVEYRHCA